LGGLRWRFLTAARQHLKLIPYDTSGDNKALSPLRVICLFSPFPRFHLIPTSLSPTALFHCFLLDTPKTTSVFQALRVPYSVVLATWNRLLCLASRGSQVRLLVNREGLPSGLLAQHTGISLVCENDMQQIRCSHGKVSYAMPCKLREDDETQNSNNNTVRLLFQRAGDFQCCTVLLVEYYEYQRA